jgi:hypothetical protein
MNWILVVVLFGVFVWAMAKDHERSKAWREKRRRAQLAFLKMAYEKTDSKDAHENLVIIAESLIDESSVVVTMDDRNTIPWWKDRIKEEEERFAASIERLGSLIEEVDELESKSQVQIRG